ncbi:Pyoverdine/dityrosine biosynthesis protein-domain-containing protein [Hypoxylon sp. FL1150]|nr:Pyoverdine/dityrosine biosynthesis protein-domain-containing protein [Hypoxylon sp. FL1150]
MPSALKLQAADILISPSSPTGDSEKLDLSYLDTASQILNIISKFKLAEDAYLAGTKDAAKFLANIHAGVVAKKSILMCLPAFPFKSPNNASKVLGRLPDKAEEFALAHLNGLCAAIGDIYLPGARLMIVSDGLVYNDLLGVPDRDVWAYGEALRALRIRKDFRHIEFCRLKDIVDVDVPDELDEIRYVANATNFRHALLQQFSKPGYNASLRISEDEDTCSTYRGYIKFLETDLQNVYPIGEGRTKSKYKRGVEYIAKQMLTRGDAFARAVRQTFPDRLRLSIHPSTGENKLSINLLPTDTSFTTPWHCSIAFRLDGTAITGHRSQFDANDDFELVHERGRPSFFRQKSSLLSWADEKGGITCEPVYPTGLLIRPAKGRNSLSVRDIDMTKVRALSQFNSPVVLRDFARTRNGDLFAAKVRELSVSGPRRFEGPDIHGIGADSHGFNTNITSGSEVSVSMPPRFQFFRALAESPKDTGPTLFSSSTLIFNHLPAHLTSSTRFNTIRGLSLVVNNPGIGRPCLRFRQSRPQSEPPPEAPNVTLNNETCDEDADGASITSACESLLYDRRVAYYHVWEKGDLLVSDNTLASIHQKGNDSATFNGELWIAQID